MVFKNTRGYSAKNVEVNVLLPNEIDFLYSDIIRGQESVQSTRTTANGLVIVFDSVLPFETKRVLLRKSEIIARTITKTTKASGIGNGMAEVQEITDFDLAMPINSLDVPENAVIDGGLKNTQLKQGTHKMNVEYTLFDAYSEERKINAYGIGINTRLEQQIVLTPKINLESVEVFIPLKNNTQATGNYSSAVASISLSVLAGADSAKGMQTGTEYIIALKNLRNGTPAVVSLAYTIENTEQYVKNEINGLTSLYPPQSNSSEIIIQAKAQADGGNYTKALELIEKAKAQAIKETAEENKQQAAYKQNAEEIVKEIEKINNVLGSVNTKENSANDSNNTFIIALEERKTYLENTLKQSNSSNKTILQKISDLEKIDSKWAQTQITTIKKESYKTYNNLKERFAKAGNLTTPQEFLNFEAALKRLESSNSLEDALPLTEALEKVRKIVETAEKENQKEKSNRTNVIREIESETNSILDQYKKQETAAKGTEYASLFGESQNTQKVIKELEGAANSAKELFETKLDALNQSKNRMIATLSQLKNESEAKYSIVKNTIDRWSLEETKRNSINAKLQIAKAMIEKAEYVNALRALGTLAKELDSTTQQDNNPLIFGLTALAVLAVVGVYIVKQQGIELWKKEKKEFRKLKKEFEE
ncbi:hypothetical protein HZC07_02100 [Candidatus Micrarchaeota archaeon]|nr:hypothetical protein [Candidatus Micrarchaeota archaeon]